MMNLESNRIVDILAGCMIYGGRNNNQLKINVIKLSIERWTEESCGTRNMIGMETLKSEKKRCPSCKQ